MKAAADGNISFEVLPVRPPILDSVNSIQNQG